MKIMAQLAITVCISILTFGCAFASDTEDLEVLLIEFLAAADEESAHRRFWADDLVYTSSDGTRFGKAEILAGFESTEPADEAAALHYSAEETGIRVFGDMAIVAFKLVGTPMDKSDAVDVLYYYNTGTFLKRDGVWQVVAWQATKIPPQ